MICLFGLLCSHLLSQPNLIEKLDNQLILQNQCIKRAITIDSKSHSCYTSQLMLLDNAYDYNREKSVEFSMQIDNHWVNGRNDFTYQKHEIIQHNDGSWQLQLKLSGAIQIVKDIEIQLNYIIYPNLPVIRKWIQIKNKGNQEIQISDLFWEQIMMDPWGSNSCDIYGNYGNYWFKPPYIAGSSDPAVLVKGKKGGFILGNESPGIMKYMSIYYNKNNEIKIGMNPSDHDYPFRKYLKPGESFESPKGFILLAEPNDPTYTFEEKLMPFLRNHMNIKLFNRNEFPLFYYCTWNDFRTEINDKLIMELADRLEGTGVDVLIIDDGWQDTYGDWNAHPERFPDGLKTTCDYIRSKGMDPGLWISLNSLEQKSKAYEKYHQYAVKDKEGNPTNLHGWANDLSFVTANILSPWYDYIKKIIIKLVQDNGIKYLKIDLSMVKSAYIMEIARSGSYETNDFHKGGEEFLYLSYQCLLDLFDDLDQAIPECIIDCTFEIWGDWHGIDYAVIQHADVDYLANLEAKPPQGSRDVRDLAKLRSNVIPTGTILIGNQRIEAENHQFSYLSNLATLPLMHGDPRELSAKEKQWYKLHSDWFANMQNKYNILPYYQTAGVFDNPAKGNWDGFARINTENDGGILCVFRNDSPDSKRNFRIPWIKGTHQYEIIEAVTQKSLGKFNKDQLIGNGVEININKPNQARVFEVKPVK